MTCREFLNLYGNWNKIVYIYDDTINLNLIIKGKPEVVLSYKDTYEREVVSFGIHNNELCVRVR